MMLMKPILSTLLSEIEAFIARKGMSATAFGVSAVNERNFVFDLRNGARDFGASKIDSARKYMAIADAPSPASSEAEDAA